MGPDSPFPRSVGERDAERLLPLMHRGARARVQVVVLCSSSLFALDPGGVGPGGVEREVGWYGEPPSRS